ncbi:MAG TPA: DUF2961 domain-containing protein [Phycisphaerae bacterium]|nr:DUF2961 domain-containing protein [Phycisphaerae bacterium]HOJ73462.1 DUF2961 domain-containing protein [Phycisphaerae bacterium]HOM51071.1 DUF2961 domain-containing protein [Phycisphaerae bacterium]HPP25701.1 DUF2961 domain-containing protein [Phycisphaerae bacterium]HPU26662.1 DUF2961 domain-containing protein [Phycisphaerae bacterium]
MNHRLMLVLMACLVWHLLPHPARGQSLEHLMRFQDYTAHRATSSDPSGGNLDMRRVDAGRTLTLAELDGPGVITHIWFTLLHPSRGALRQMVFRVYFDDMPEPCVEAPLGDFFGLGHAQTYAYASEPLAVGTNKGMNCYWPMPFARKARLTVSNDGRQDCLSLYYQIDYRKLDRPAADGLYFHAAYRQAFPPAKGEPYVILDTDGGRGHFVGCNLSIEQQDESWWGEGDIRIYVDGEQTPSIAGTGSEDDFGGAWCYSHEFAFAWFGAPLRARFNTQGVLEHCTPDLRGKDLTQWRWPEAWKPGDLWNVYRYHVADPVPFRKSILVNIEHGWKNNERADWYSSVAYWYQTGTPSKRVALPAVEDRIPKYLRPQARGQGRWEAEDLVDSAQASAGKLQEAGMEFWGDLFSHRYALEWNANAPGDTLVLPFTVAGAGRYGVTVRLTRIEPGGIFTVALDDHPPTEPVNLYGPPPFPDLFELTLSPASLEPGKHTLTFTFKGADEKSKGKRLLLDKFHVHDAAASQPPQ